MTAGGWLQPKALGALLCLSISAASQEPPPDRMKDLGEALGRVNFKTHAYTGIGTRRIWVTGYLPDTQEGYFAILEGALTYRAAGQGFEPAHAQPFPPIPGWEPSRHPLPGLDAEGRPWALTPKGLYRLEGGTWVVKSPPLPQELTWSLWMGGVQVVDDHQVLIVTTTRAQAVVVDPKDWSETWRVPYPPAYDRITPSAPKGYGGAYSGEFWGPLLVQLGGRTVIYYAHSGRVFAADCQRRAFEELDVPWFTRGDASRRGSAQPRSEDIQGGMVVAEFPVNATWLATGAEEALLMGTGLGKNPVWKVGALDLGRRRVTWADLELPPKSLGASYSFRTAKGEWVPLKTWGIPSNSRRPNPGVQP